jgi:hypothetical protein
MVAGAHVPRRSCNLRPRSLRQSANVWTDAALQLLTTGFAALRNT